YQTKKGHVERFLKQGHKVKVTIMFRGREMAHTDLGRRILDRLVNDLEGLAVVEAVPKQDGRNMVMVIAPTKKQVAAARAEQPRPREAKPEPVKAEPAASTTEQG
ncbi:MAG: translation initiation factor IF-3, partial [Actinomycetota bacterium]